MTLIKSISGIRGTIGGKPGDNLTPADIVKFVSGYALYISDGISGEKIKVIVGRDARISGMMVNSLVCGTLMGMGIDVIDLGLSTTPTVEIAVTEYRAQGGIIITASHNPAEWNAFKLLDSKGEFLNDSAGRKVLANADLNLPEYCKVEKLGSYKADDTFIDSTDWLFEFLERYQKEITGYIECHRARTARGSAQGNSPCARARRPERKCRV